MSSNPNLSAKIPLALRREIRLAVGAHERMPIVISGLGAPRFEGESYHWVTPGTGRRIYHPGAYAKHCRRPGSDPVYVASTRRLVVGVDWVIARLAGVSL